MSKQGRLEHAGRRFLSTGEFRFIQHSTRWTGHSPHLTNSLGIGQDDEKAPHGIGDTQQSDARIDTRESKRREFSSLLYGL